jgi:ectoine hydroxylase-related dioxygenase (phytanoyl-CoA dioxygenase family)
VNSPSTRSALTGEVGVFATGDLDPAREFFDEHGFATLRACYDEAELIRLEDDLRDTQRRLLAGELPERCGTVVLDDPDAVVDGEPFAHYVCHVTEVSEVARQAALNPAVVDMARRVLGSECWLLEDDRFGVVYQDARPGSGSGYSRIGWHADEQSGPNLDWWPSIAFTIHLDATSPQNGFLRVVPGSHHGDADGMPLGFEKIRGELALYCERGDVLVHHSALWHSAARATDDGELGIRRHVRGGWYGGRRPDGPHGTDDFVKNARR